MKPIEFLVQKYRILTKLEIEVHAPASRIKLFLSGDIHDLFIRVLIAMSRYVPRNELEEAINTAISIIYDSSLEDYKDHSSCYTRLGFRSRFAIKKKRLPSRKRSRNRSDGKSTSNQSEKND